MVNSVITSTELASMDATKEEKEWNVIKVRWWLNNLQAVSAIFQSNNGGQGSYQRINESFIIQIGNLFYNYISLHVYSLYRGIVYETIKGMHFYSEKKIISLYILMKYLSVNQEFCLSYACQLTVYLHSTLCLELCTNSKKSFQKRCLYIFII